MDRDLVDRDKRYVWHPFTQMQEWCAGEPLVIERGEGNYLVDVAGRRYLDGVSSLWTNVHGHNRAELNAAIEAQLGRVAHSTLLGLANVPSIELAERLVELSPEPLSKVFYSDSGSTAVEIALKQAFQYWQLRGKPNKRRFVHLSEAYHGDTLGAVAVGGIEIFHRIFAPLLVDSFVVPTPHPFHHPERSPAEVSAASLAALQELLEHRGEELAAVIVEPCVQGAGGMIVHPRGFLRGVRELCRAHEVLLIADEVATGFGRTGRMFACEHEDVAPDFMCLAKGISGGYLPLAATLTTEEVYSAFLGHRSDSRAFFHGHTYTGNPLACAAGVASLRLFETEDVLNRVESTLVPDMGVLLREHVAAHPAVADIRQCGLMVGIELMADPAARRPFEAREAVGARVCDAVRRHGVILRPLGDVVVLMPPLSITRQELELLVTSVASALSELL